MPAQTFGALYADEDGWARKAIVNVTGSGKFSSDRTITQYAAESGTQRLAPRSKWLNMFIEAVRRSTAICEQQENRCGTMGDTFLNYFALGLLIFVLITLFYGIIAIHDVPYELAKHRNHPHQDAIHAAGWVSLFTLHAIWPFLWIWALLYRPDRGWGFRPSRRVAAERPAKAERAGGTAASDYRA